MDLADVGNYTSAFYEKKVVFLRHMSIKMLFSLLINFVVMPVYLSGKSLVTDCVVTLFLQPLSLQYLKVQSL